MKKSRKQHSNTNGRSVGADQTTVKSEFVAKVPIALNGPVEKYLRIKGVSHEDFIRLLRAGNANAVSLFGADVVYAKVEQALEAIERRDDERHTEQENF